MSESPEDAGPSGARPESTECCGPASAEGGAGDASCCAGPGGGQDVTPKVRAVIFAVVLAAAGALVALGLIKRQQSPEADGRTARFADATSTDGGPPASSERGAQPDAGQALCGRKLSSLAAVDELAGDADAVFVLLPGARGPTAGTAKRIEAAVGKISSQGTRVRTFTMNEDAEGYARLVDRLAIESFPSVVVLCRGRGVATASGEISEGDLLRAFVVASRVPVCGPSGCGPAPDGLPSSGAPCCGE